MRAVERTLSSFQGDGVATMLAHPLIAKAV